MLGPDPIPVARLVNVQMRPYILGVNKQHTEKDRLRRKDKALVETSVLLMLQKS